MLKNITTSAVTAIIIAILVVSLSGGSRPTPPQEMDPDFGSFTETVKITLGRGFEALESSEVSQNLVRRRINSTTTSATAQTLVPSDFIKYATISVLPTTGSVNWYLPASTTFPTTFLPRLGDWTDFMLINASTTAGINVGLIAGTGTLVHTASSTPANVASTTAATASRVTVLRKANTDLLFMVAPFKP